MTYRWRTCLVILAVFAVAGTSSGVASGASSLSVGTTGTATNGQPRSDSTDLGQRVGANAADPATPQTYFESRVIDRMTLVASILFSALAALFLGARILVRHRASKAALSGASMHSDQGSMNAEGTCNRQTAFERRKADLTDPGPYRVAS